MVMDQPKKGLGSKLLDKLVLKAAHYQILKKTKPKRSLPSLGRNKRQILIVTPQKLSGSGSKEATDFSSTAVLEPEIISSILSLILGVLRDLSKVSLKVIQQAKLWEVRLWKKGCEMVISFLSGDFCMDKPPCSHIFMVTQPLTSKTLPLMYRSQVSHLIPNWEW